jgi:hypothetical protein
MNFQEKLFETTAELRALAAKRVQILKGSLATLTVAGRELNQVARRHAVRFVKENSTIAVEAGRDVSALAQSTYTSLVKRQKAGSKSGKTAATRKAVATRKLRTAKAA